MKILNPVPQGRKNISDIHIISVVPSGLIPVFLFNPGIEMPGYSLTPLQVAANPFIVSTGRITQINCAEM